MKILEINKYNFSKGGADKHFLDLVKLLRAKGNKVAVFAMDHSQNEFSVWKKYFVSYVGYNQNDSSFWQKINGIFRMFYSLEAKRKIKKLLLNFRPDIVHIHNIYHQISPSILFEIKKRGIPIVMTVHDYALICPDYLLQCNGEKWEKVKKKSWFYFVKKKCFKNSYLKSLLAILKFNLHSYWNIYDKNIDLYISPSQFTKNILIKNGIKENKIMVMPHFYSKINFKEREQVLIKEKYALYAGRISRDKGIEELVKAFKNIKNVSLYLAGKIEGDFKLRESGNVKYLGFLSQKELLRYIEDSLFVVSFSKLPETFGLIALEAIGRGKPFIGFGSGAYGEVIENNRTGFICNSMAEISKKIEILAKDEGLRILFSRNALDDSQKFNSESYYGRIMRLFSALTKINK